MLSAMQISSERNVVRLLPPIWGRHLLHAFKCNLTALNRTVVRKPNGRPFRLLKNPRPLSKKGVPKLLERVINQGHWPDHGGYLDEDDGRFNLVERVAAHLPGSQDWLFADLKRFAQEQPTDPAQLNEAIDRTVERFGMKRMDIFASMGLYQILGERMEDIHQHTWTRLSRYDEPVHATLLTLLWAERRMRRFDNPKLRASCMSAWARFLRKEEFRRDRVHQKGGLTAIREILAFININERSRDGSAIDRIPRCHCLVWRPTKNGLKAEQLIHDFYQATLYKRLRHVISSPLHRSVPKPVNLPEGISTAVATILENVLESMSCWDHWDPTYRQASPGAE